MASVSAIEKLIDEVSELEDFGNEFVQLIKTFETVS